jgi:hypothetical protein
MITVILVLALVLGAGWTVWRRRGRGRPPAAGTGEGRLCRGKTMAGVTQCRNDPDRPFKNIRRNKHVARSNNRKPPDGSRPNNAGPMPPRRGANLPSRWPTGDPSRHLRPRREIGSVSQPNRGRDRRQDAGAPSEAAHQS